jgi:hypothetical protein
VRFIHLGWMLPTVALWVVSSPFSHSQMSQIGWRLSSPALAAPVKASAAAKTAQFLEQFGGSYTKASEAIWVVPFKGKALSEFDVIVATSSDSNLLVMGVTVAKKQNLKLSQPLLYRLLKYNNTADYVKVGFDDDEDLFVRAELSTKTTDFPLFKEVLEQVGAAADELYAQIKPSLIAAPVPSPRPRL